MTTREQNRDLVFGAIRRSLGVTGLEATRRREVADRIAAHPVGVVPARGQLPPEERLALFVHMVEAAAGTVERIAAADDIPAAVARFLRGHNLPMQVKRGGDPLLASAPWEREGTLEVAVGRSDGRDLTGLSRAIAAVAETGTLVLASGPDNPTTLNFLPDNHLVVIGAKDVAGDFETVIARLRAAYGEMLPRVVNMITGPSRSADIEQTLILGAHGPRRLHVLVLGNPEH
jgi:L-lactate dehydrogenase complex protein LldG